MSYATSPVFVTELVDAYKGQRNLEIHLKVKGEILAVLEYTLFREEVQISMITVRRDHRRKGYATMLVKRLQQDYPENEIDWGGFLTDDGAALKSSLPVRQVASPFARLFSKLDAWQQTFDEAVAKIDLLDSMPGISTVERAYREELTATAIRAERAAEVLREYLGRAPRTLSLIDTTEPVQLVQAPKVEV